MHQGRSGVSGGIRSGFGQELQEHKVLTVGGSRRGSWEGGQRPDHKRPLCCGANVDFSAGI